MTRRQRSTCIAITIAGIVLALIASALLVAGWFNRTEQGAYNIMAGLFLWMPAFLMITVPILEIRDAERTHTS